MISGKPGPTVEFKFAIGADVELKTMPGKSAQVRELHVNWDGIKQLNCRWISDKTDTVHTKWFREEEVS